MYTNTMLPKINKQTETANEKVHRVCVELVAAAAVTAVGCLNAPFK